MTKFSNAVQGIAAVVIGLCLATQAYAFPDSVREREILQVDLAGSIPDAELSVVVMMPESCSGVEKTLLCQQFRAFTPGTDKKYIYSVQDASSKRKSISGQVQVLPAATRERRFVMLVDWTYSTERRKSQDYLELNGEVTIYDQLEKKVVWHAIALRSVIKMEETFADAASRFLTYDAISGAQFYGRMVEAAKANGFGMQAASSVPQANAGILVIFNQRVYSFGGFNSDIVVVKSIGKPAEASPVWFAMSGGAYMALSVPPGKYLVSYGHKKEIEIEVSAQQRRAYELTLGFSNSYGIREVSGEALAKLSTTSRNFLLPDVVSPNRYHGALAWSDIAPGDQPAVPATVAPAAVLQPVRAARATARLRFFGNLGTKIDFYENRMCYRGDAKGTDVSGADGAAWAWLKGKNESYGVGMPDTQITLAIKAKPKGGRYSYYREFEIQAGKPMSVGMSDAITYGVGTPGEHKVSCQSGRSFIPVAGADYEVSFEMNNDGCTANVREISIEDEHVRHFPVELARVRECR
jgi:hypothetical protein